MIRCAALFFLLATVRCALAADGEVAVSVTPLPARAAQVEVPAIRVQIPRVTESRTRTSGGSLNLTLSISSEGQPTVAGIWRVTLLRAADDADRPLAVAPRDGSASRVAGRQPLAQPGRLDYSLNLILPATPRESQAIKFIEGTIDLVFPPMESDAVLRIAGVARRPGPIHHPRLQAEQIAFEFYPTRESYDAARNALSARVMGPPNLREGSTFGFPNSAIYYIHDPNDRFRSYHLENGKGERLPFMPRPVAGSSILTTGMIEDLWLSAPLPDDTVLALTLKAVEVFRTVPFRVENIPLP